MSKVINYRSPEEGVELRRADEVESIASNWHIQGWLPAGEFVILGGDGGAGKTLIAMDWVATLSNADTRHGVFFDGTKAQRGSSLIWSCEDDLNRVLKPRLDAAGANYRKIFFVGDVIEFGRPRKFDFKRDLSQLIKQIVQIGDVRILVIDTVMEAVSGGGNNAKKVRQDLLKLVDIAHRYQITVIGIAHLVKDSKKGDPVKNLAGSQAFSNLARHVLIAMKVNSPERDASSPSLGVLTCAKSNIGKSGGGRVYEIHSVEVKAHDGRSIETTKLIWRSPEFVASSTDIRRWADGQKDEMVVNPRSVAQEFLLQILKAGPISANEAHDLAEEEGITSKMLRVARDKLGVVSTRRRDEAGFRNEWSLPDQLQDFKPLIDLHSIVEEQARNLGQVGQVGQAGQLGQDGQVQETYELGDRHASNKILNARLSRSGF